MTSINVRTNEPNQKELRENFSYDKNLGRLRWKVVSPFASAKVGDIAGWANKNHKYRNIRFNGLNHSEHRLIWIYHYGAIPKGKTPDHINMNRSDNRISNLRLLTDAEQVYAKLARGFCWDKRNKKWTATITKNWKIKHLGRFKTALLARLAYEKATVDRHPTINHTQFTVAIKHMLVAGPAPSLKLLDWLANR